MPLKQIPNVFNADSEEDLRYAVACYFSDLGFDIDELSFEDQFSIRLGHNVVIVGQEGKQRHALAGRSDLLLTRNGRPLAVVETKAPDHELLEEDAWQAISYARLLLTMAPFAILTNGRDTRVYDPYSGTLDELDSAHDSVWHRNGQNVRTIADDLRYEATRHLIGVNEDTLQAFCSKQVSRALDDLKGEPGEGSLYIPAVYAVRQEVTKSLEAWLASEDPCFAVVGDSGAGKTNFMCASAEASLDGDFVLFYQSARLLAGGLGEAIRDDFVWEFRREHDIAYVIDRLDSVAAAHGRKLVIFLDALDEFPGSRDLLRNQLLDFVGRIHGRSVKLCVSCKSYDWSEFVIEKRQYYNSLAKGVWPSARLSNRQVDPRMVGVWLTRFSDAELDEAYEKYKAAFELSGDLTGTLRVECQTPIMLRLVAEAYQLHEGDLPDEVTSSEVYRRYWLRQMGLIADQRVAETIVSDVARLAVDRDSRLVGLVELQRVRNWTDVYHEAYDDLLRVGFLREMTDSVGARSVTFGFDRMRSYVYVEYVRHWEARPPSEVAPEVLDVLSKPLGLETVVFYITTVECGRTGVLTELASRDLLSFVNLLRLDLRSPLEEAVAADQVSDALSDRLVQYAETYSILSRQYFASICEKIAPYTKLDVGIWVCDNSYQFRGCTEEYPDPVVLVPREVAASVFARNATREVHQYLCPGGTLYTGMDDFHRKLPQEIAWERLMGELGVILDSRLLDESGATVLLEEKIWDMLIHEPSSWFGGSPESHIHYWQLLDYGSPEALFDEAVGDLRERTATLLREYQTRVQKDIETKKHSPAAKEALTRITELLRLHYWLGELMLTEDHLRGRPYSLDEYFSYFTLGLTDSVLSIVRTILPETVNSYRSLITSNFPLLTDYLALMHADPRQVAVEVSWNPKGRVRTDYLTLSYIVFSDFALPEPYTVFTCDVEESVANLSLVPSPGVVSRGGSYGTANLTLDISGVMVKNQEVTIYLARFPSHHPVLDQVYQLIVNEFLALLGGRRMLWNWPGLGRDAADDRLDWWSRRQYLLRGTN